MFVSAGFPYELNFTLELLKVSFHISKVPFGISFTLFFFFFFFLLQLNPTRYFDLNLKLFFFLP